MQAEELLSLRIVGRKGVLAEENDLLESAVEVLVLPDGLQRLFYQLLVAALRRH